MPSSGGATTPIRLTTRNIERRERALGSVALEAIDGAPLCVARVSAPDAALVEIGARQRDAVRRQERAAAVMVLIALAGALALFTMFRIARSLTAALAANPGDLEASYALASALAAGKLLGLSAEQLVAAQGIALSLASGNLQFLEDGAWTKRLHPGWAACKAALGEAIHALNRPERPRKAERA